MLERTKVVGGALLLSLGSVCWGQILIEDFESYAVGSDPSGPGITIGGSSFMSVEAAPLGFATQALLLSPPTGVYAGALYDFPPVTTGVVRFETQMSFSDLSEGTIFQTATSGFVWSRLLALPDGTIAAQTPSGQNGPVIGPYSPGSPLAIRMDLDLDAFTWSASVDDELDGFANDPVVSGLAPLASAATLTNVSQAAPTWHMDGDATPATVAYDNLLVIPAPGAAALVALGLGGLGARRRRVVTVGAAAALGLGGVCGASIMEEGFEGYMPGEDPSGPNVTLYGPEMMHVASAPLGHATQALLLEPPPGEVASVRYAMDPRSTGKVRFEVDVSIYDYIDGRFFETGTAANTVWTRLFITDSGDIIAASQSTGDSTVGAYTPGTPFRMRMDVDLDAMLYWVAIDNEMDGFADDPLVGPWLPYSDVGNLPNIGGAFLTFKQNPDPQRIALPSLAYDNLFVIPAPGVAVGALAIGGLIMTRRRG
jgi:hypothetical protein